MVGASNAARTAEALERAGAVVLCAVLPGWRCLKMKVPAMVELIKKQLEGANPRCVAVFQLYDSSFHFARTEEGSLIPACRSLADGKFHTQGEAVVAFTATKAVLEAVGKLQKVIISPLPRHLFNSCCQDPDHCTNIGTAGYREETESAIIACRKNLKDFCFRHDIGGCKVICPWSSIRRRVDELWMTLDPIHMTTVGYDLVAGMVLEAYAGGTDQVTRKRPLPSQEASQNKKTHM